MARRIAILTGSNRGLGKRTAEILLEKHAEGFHYIFTQRSADSTELKAAFSKINAAASFEILPLEVTNKASRDAFLKDVAAKHKQVDVIFNNAGFYDHANDKGNRVTSEVARYTLTINFTSTVEFTEEILPLLSDDARIVEVSSILGQLSFQPKEGQAILSNPNLTREQLFEINENYINNVGDASKEIPFSNQVYYFSKALLTTWVRFVGTKIIKPNQTIISLHPGWVQTDMGGESAPLTVDQACPHLATTLAGLPFGRHELNGKHIFENKVIDF